MKLHTPFTIPQKENSNLCRIDKNKIEVVEKPFREDRNQYLNGVINA